MATIQTPMMSTIIMDTMDQNQVRITMTIIHIKRAQDIQGTDIAVPVWICMVTLWMIIWSPLDLIILDQVDLIRESWI